MFDVEEVLEKLQNQGLVRLHKRRGDWYSVYCPFHAEGQERRPSCGVSMVEQYRAGSVYQLGMWHCFTCNAGYDMVTAISKILESKGIEGSGEQWLKDNITGYEPDPDFEYLIDPQLSEMLESKFAVKAIQEMENGSNSYVSEEELASYRYTVPYMYERRLTDEIIDLYDVGYDRDFVPPGRKKKAPSITIPVRDSSGKTLFLCRRTIKGKMYNYPEGVLKPLFGVDVIPRGTRSVVVCESAINVMTCTVYGYPAVGLLGTGNQYQIRQLRQLGVDEFVICMDGDGAGRRASARLKKSLSDIAIVWIIDMPDGKDVNDCTKDEFDELYSQRQ